MEMGTLTCPEPAAHLSLPLPLVLILVSELAFLGNRVKGSEGLQVDWWEQTSPYLT